MNRRHIQADLLSQTHGNEFRFDDAVEVITRRKFGDELALAILNQHLGSGTTQGGTVQQGLIQFRRQHHTSIDLLGSR